MKNPMTYQLPPRHFRPARRVPRSAYPVTIGDVLMVWGFLLAIAPGCFQAIF